RLRLHATEALAEFLEIPQEGRALFCERDAHRFEDGVARFRRRCDEPVPAAAARRDQAVQQAQRVDLFDGHDRTNLQPIADLARGRQEMGEPPGSPPSSTQYPVPRGASNSPLRNLAS